MKQAMICFFHAVCWILVLILASSVIQQPRLLTVGAFSPPPIRCARSQEQASRQTATVHTLSDSEQPVDNDNTNNNTDKGSDVVSGCSAWQRIGPPIATLSSPWLTVLAERYQDNSNHLVDYWRIQRASSVIVVVIHRKHYILPTPQFRPGVQRCTLDFVGGRCSAASAKDKDTTLNNNNTILDMAKRLLVKELGLSSDTIESCVKWIPLNSGGNSNPNSIIGWPVDSSVSNQELYGVVAIVDDSISLVQDQSSPSPSSSPSYNDMVMYPVESVNDLLDDLKCLQCRTVLFEWLYQQQKHVV